MNCLTLDFKKHECHGYGYRIGLWPALISASGTTDNVSKWKYDYYRHSRLLYLCCRKFKFRNGQTTEI